jgi:hypothetical protein
MAIAPTAPKDFEKNWIPTVPGQAWFPLRRTSDVNAAGLRVRQVQAGGKKE